MLAIGFLSLLSVGFAVMSVGGDEGMDEDAADDVSDIDAFADILEDYASAGGGFGIELAPGEEIDPEFLEQIDPEILEQIDDFVESVEANPDQSLEDLVDDVFEFVDGLDLGGDQLVDPDDVASDLETTTDTVETELTPDTAEDTGEIEDTAESEVARPPMGDEYRDPLQLAEERDAQRILDEIAAEEARQPENLVTVSDGSGAEIDDTAVMQARTEDASEDDPAFTVTAPDSPNSIDVGYDHEHTFAINFSAETMAVTAGLNSIIQGPDGALEQSSTIEEDANGVEVEMLTTTMVYEGATEITLEIAPEDIGTHSAQIDLTNPDDLLHFEFEDEITGNLHLVYYDAEDGREGDSSTTKRAIVVQTSEDVTSLSASDVATILADEDGQMEGASVLAEIFLGEDSVVLNGDPDDGVPYQIRTNDFINDDPMITTNVAWTSVGVHDDGAEDQGNAAEDGSGGMSDGEDDAIEDVFENAGLNPAFFGF